MAELRHYRYVVEIARRGTFTAAAEALHMTQSALSEQVLQFERECGCQLFERRRSGAVLTPAGEHLLPRAEELLAKAVEAQESLARFRQGYAGRVRIGTIMGPTISWLPLALAQFAELEPQVQIQVETYHVDETVAGVLAGRLDLGIINLGENQRSRLREQALHQTLLLEEPMVLVVPEGHGLAGNGAVGADQLRDQPLVTFPAGYHLRQLIDGWYRRAGCSPQVAAETGSPELVFRLLTSGVGVAILPRSLAGQGQDRGLRCLELAPPDGLQRKVVAVQRATEADSELLRRLTSLLALHASDLRRRDALSAPGEPAVDV